MKVVIAGGTGLLGRAIARAMVADRWKVVVLSRGIASRGVPPEARIVTWDGRTLDPGWITELEGADAVINLAGASVGRWPWTAAWRRTLVSSRVLPTRALVDAIKTLPIDHRPPVLLNASGTDRYEGSDEVPATEETPAGDTFVARLCQAWESEALAASALGVRVVLLRFSLVVARGAPALSRLVLPFRLGVGGRLGSGRQWVSWIDVRDAVGIVRWALVSPEVEGPLNVCAPEPLRQTDVASAIGRTIHRPAWLPIPAGFLRLALGPQATLVLGSRRVCPKRALDGGYEFEVIAIEDALRNALQSLPG
jgi:uncharacterized protein (TIGR01777 family)